MREGARPERRTDARARRGGPSVWVRLRTSFSAELSALMTNPLVCRWLYTQWSQAARHTATARAPPNDLTLAGRGAFVNGLLAIASPMPFHWIGLTAIPGE